MLLFGGVIQVWFGAHLCRCHRYTAYRPPVTLLGLYVKGHSCPTAFLCCPQDTRRVSTARVWRVSRSARVTELLGIIILGFESVPMLLDSLFLKWLLHSSREIGDSCNGSGLSALDLVHSSTTSCTRSPTYSEETQFTFISKYVKYQVNSWK